MVRVVVIGNNGLGVGGLEKRHGVSSFDLEEGGVGTVGALVNVMFFVLATETSDPGVRDAIRASNHFARLHKSHAIFFLDCRLLAARVAARLFPLGGLEIDKQAVGCGQVDGILVVPSGELVFDFGPKCAKTTTVGSLQESQSESAVTRNLEAFRGVVGVGRDSGSSIQLTLVFANGAAIVLQDLNKGTEMLEVGGNRVFGALSVGVVGGARVVERKVDVTIDFPYREGSWSETRLHIL
jgi:hypothetical protein